MKKILALLLIGGLVVLLSCSKGGETGKEIVVPVRTFILKADSIATYLEVTGGLEAGHDALVYSTIAEKLVEIRKPVGSWVRKNEVIAVQDNDLWKEILKQAKAALSSAQARFEQVKSDYQRFERLYQEKAISQQQWDQIKATYQDAESGLRRAKAAYLQSKEQYDNTFIRAPFDGMVGTFNFEVGEMIPAGQPVTRIVNNRLVKAELYVPDIHIGRLKIGQPVLGLFPNYPGKRFYGKVTRIDPTIDPQSRTFRVVVSFENKQGELKSGMFGRFYITTEFHRQTLVVPDNAVITRTELKVDPQTGETYTVPRRFVFVVEDSVARLRPVKTGIESRGRVEILQGLRVGDQVIVVGQKVVKDGEKVHIVSPGEE